MALRRGLRVVKSGRRDPRAIDYGRYCITDENKCAVAGFDPNGRPSMTMDEVGEYLEGDGQ